MDEIRDDHIYGTMHEKEEDIAELMPRFFQELFSSLALAHKGCQVVRNRVMKEMKKFSCSNFFKGGGISCSQSI